MSSKKENKDLDKETVLTDNVAGDVSKEQTNDCPAEENLAEHPEESDSVSEELAKLKDSYLRLMAEYDNYRKRTIKEKADLIRNGGEKTLTGLLPVIDDFDRAMKTIETATDILAIKEGLSLIYSKFVGYLQQNGVKSIETLGLVFDPDLHEAIATIPATSEEMAGKVIDTVQTGYTLNDKVIRHAKVVVAN
jgi:molecular chaperone GrpE